MKSVNDFSLPCALSRDITGIFGKLQIQRRTEAVARAQELGLLS
jgi:hypothetical protein